MVSFQRSAEENRIMGEIVARAQQEMPGLDENTLYMDIAAVHANGTRLDLQRWLEADKFNFWHDIVGINRHIDRKTGKLNNCFLPRFATPQSL
jgi:hypothetical protein